MHDAPTGAAEHQQPYPFTIGGAQTGARHSASIDAPGDATQFDFSHPRVDDFVQRFQTDMRDFFEEALSRSGRYVPRMTSILEKEGVPQELAYLPLIESGFRTSAVSRAGAVGPWQFIRTTGRRYGLRIDRYVDERRDPVKSTRAAARYLKDLYAMFGDWHLSLAAYNTGEGNINRILDDGGPGDFWELSDRGYLYRETENYVPQFLAALQIAEEPEAYGFDAPDGEPLRYDVVTVRRQLSLATIAQLSGTSAGIIKELNPALHRGMLPPHGYTVRLPKGSKETFEVAYANLPRTELRTRHPAAKRARRGKAVRSKHRGRRRQVVAAAAGRQQYTLHRLHAPTIVASLEGTSSRSR
jgi:membrane-bound lytic murein transglycosylase D